MSDKVQQFLAILDEFVDGLKVGHPDKQDLSEFCTPDFVQKSATSIFISETQNNGFRNTVPASTESGTPAPGDKKEVKGILQKKSVSKNPAGKSQYGVQIGGQWYNTLDSKAFGGYTFSEGEEVIAEVAAGKINSKTGQPFWNLKKLTAANPAEDEEIPF